MPESRDGDEPSHRRRVVGLIIAATILRAALAAWIGLGVDESYAYAVARPLSLSYFDHPPLVFWIVGIASRFTDNGAWLRTPFIGLSAVTTWLIYRMTAYRFGERAGFFAAAVFSLAPVLSVSTGSWILPDGPLMFGESLAALAIGRVVFGDARDARDEGARLWWGAFIAGMGTALLTKYHAALFIVGLLLFCMTTPRARRLLRRPEPYVALAILVLIAMPVVVWNYEHDWASVRFQLGRGSNGHVAPIESLLRNVGGQMGYLLPWIWIPMIATLVRGFRTGPRDESRWFFACLAVVPIVLFTLASLGGSPGLPHWPAPGYLFAVPLAGDWLAALEHERGAHVVRRGMIAAAVALLLPVALIASQASTGWLTLRAPALFRRGDPSLDLLDWRHLSVTPPLTTLALHDATLYTTNWIDAAKLSFGLGRGADVRCRCADARHFRFLPTRHAHSTGLATDTLVVVRADSTGQPTAPDASLAAATSYAAITVMRRGQPAIHLAVLRITSRSSPPATTIR